MKIAILTHSYIKNYGGILQCVALQNKLEEKGHMVEVIHFMSSRKHNVRRRIKLLFTDFSCQRFYRWFLDICTDFFEKLIGKQKPLSSGLLENCARFIKENIHYTEICDEDTIGRLIEQRQYDAIVIGSDIVWVGLGNERLIYFGDWQPRYIGKLISYAACSTLSHVPKFNEAKLEKLLDDFSHISVRDKHTFNLIRGYTHKDIQIVADPTILYDFGHYLKPCEGEDYIFTYVLGQEIDGGHRKAIAAMKKRYGDIPVKAVVLSDESTNIVPYADEIVDDASPDVWLNLLAQSKAVYTDSFHGIIFSLKYHRPFIAYYKEASRSTRLIDLKERFGLKGNIVSSVDEIDLSKDICYDKLQPVMDVWKDESLNFLKNALI